MTSKWQNKSSAHCLGRTKISFRHLPLVMPWVIIQESNCGICIPIYNWPKLSLNITTFMAGKKIILLIPKKERESFIKIVMEGFLYAVRVWQKKDHVMKILQSISVFSSTKDCFLCTLVFCCPHTYWSAIDIERGHAERAEWHNWDLHCGPERSILPFHENRVKFDWKLLIHSAQI